MKPCGAAAGGGGVFATGGGADVAHAENSKRASESGLMAANCTYNQSIIMTSAILFRRLTGVVLAILGIAWAIQAKDDVISGIVSSGWPSTEATLIHTEVVMQRQSSKPLGRNRISYKAYATYHYTVNAAVRTADVISFGDEFVSSNRLIENLRQESPLLAHYDPDDPNRAALHPGVTFGAMYRLAIYIAMIGTGLFLLIRSPR
jgi:hypothetical protein